MGTYIGFSNSVGTTLGALLNQIPDPPEGYEELKDSADETISDSVLSTIYVLEEA